MLQVESAADLRREFYAGAVACPGKKSLEHSIALHFFVYNFITRHTTLRMPPAVKAHVTDHVWTFEELVDLIDRAEAQRIASH